MPRVPEYDYPRVSPNYLPDTRGAVPTTSAVATSLKGVGQEIERAGDILAKHALKLQDQHNRAIVDEAASEWLIAQSDLDMKARSLEGKARVDYFKTYVDESRQLREKYSNAMGNPAAKRMFDETTRRYFAYSVRNESAGVGTALKNYNTQTNTRLEKVSRERMLGDPNSDEIFEESRQNVIRARRQEGANRSYEPEETEFQVRQAESSLWSDRVGAIANQDPERALEILETNKDKMLATDYETAATKIAAGRHKIGSRGAFLAQEIDKLIENDVQSMELTGQGVPGLTISRVNALRGPAVAAQWRADREDAQTIWWHTHDAVTLPQDRMDAQLRNLEPKAGADFIRQSKIYNTTKKVFDQVKSLRYTDPAASVDNDPMVQETRTNFDSRDPNGMEVIIDARLAAQTRAGIPAGNRAPITNAEAAAKMAPIWGALPGTEPEIINNIVRDFQESYGKYWVESYAWALGTQSKLPAETRRIATGVLSAEINAQARREADAIASTMKSLEGVGLAVGEVPKKEVPKQNSLGKKILEKYGTK